MNTPEQERFDRLFDANLQTMQLHGLGDKTIDSYSRTLRRIASHFDQLPR